jgi:hypothetical protein
MGADWGGKRSGAGRPLKGTEKRQRVSATVPASQIAALDALAFIRGLSRSEALSQVIEAGLAQGLRPAARAGASLPIPPDKLQALQALLSADSVHHLRQVMMLAAQEFADPQGVGQVLHTLGLALPTFGGGPVAEGEHLVWSWDPDSVLAGAEWTDDPEWGLFVYPRDHWATMAQPKSPR